MTYCWYCKRINPGEPLYCQFCGRTFSTRLCDHCHHINPKESLVCRNCGSSELSEIAGPTPLWITVWRFLLTAFQFSVKLLVSFFIILFILVLSFLPLPKNIEQFKKPFINFLIKRVFSTKEGS